MDGSFWWMFAAAVAGSSVVAAAVALLLFLLRARLLHRMVDRSLSRLLKDPYPENLWDLVVGMTRVPPHVLLETELRADHGRLLERPLGSVVHRSPWSDIAFSPAQLARSPLPPAAPVDTSVQLGPRCPRPLRLDTPLMVSAMGYGIGVSKAFALALAHGATRAGTAYNAGSGPVLPEIAKAAHRLIVQYTGAPWSQDPQVMSQAAMVEIRIGHGARAALGRVLEADRLPAECREFLGLQPGETIVFEAAVPGGGDPARLRNLVEQLHQLTDGSPVAVKLAPSHQLEHELQMVTQAGVDVVVIDGSEGGTHASPPVIADDFGLPTLHALIRAAAFLEASGLRQQVSLVVSGGLRTPSEMLKALALGADAAYLGTVAMMACTHGQLSKAVPFEPITQLAWATGQIADRFDPDLGARNVANFIRACTEELAEAARALGKTRLQDVSREDLIALTPEMAAMADLPVSWRPPPGPS